MTIIQINYYICDMCGKTEMRSRQTDEWSDPTVEALDGWQDIDMGNNFYRLHCPNCIEKAKK